MLVRSRRGQAIIETVLAVLVITFVFLMLFNLSHVLTGKILVEHAAMRVARARAVGFNDFMILKTARLGAMSVSGECYTRMNDDRAPSTATLVSRMGSYLQTASPSETEGILDFELWRDGNLGWSCAEPHGDVCELTMHVWQKQPVFNSINPQGAPARDDAAMITLHGEAKIESHYPFYLK